MIKHQSLLVFKARSRKEVAEVAAAVVLSAVVLPVVVLSAVEEAEVPPEVPPEAHHAVDVADLEEDVEVTEELLQCTNKTLNLKNLIQIRTYAIKVFIKQDQTIILRDVD
jgi:hypothetical protein